VLSLASTSPVLVTSSFANPPSTSIDLPTSQSQNFGPGSSQGQTSNPPIHPA
jgi:hypothetical protein